MEELNVLDNMTVSTKRLNELILINSTIHDLETLVEHIVRFDDTGTVTIENTTAPKIDVAYPTIDNVTITATAEEINRLHEIPAREHLEKVVGLRTTSEKLNVLHGLTVCSNSSYKTEAACLNASEIWAVNITTDDLNLLTETNRKIWQHSSDFF